MPPVRRQAAVANLPRESVNKWAIFPAELSCLLLGRGGFAAAALDFDSIPLNSSRYPQSPSVGGSLLSLVPPPSSIDGE